MKKEHHPLCSGGDDEKLIKDVKEHGLHVVIVPEESGTPGWAFSVGLYQNYNHPEIIVIGLNRSLMHWMLNEIGSWIKQGQNVQESVQYPGLLEGYSCQFKIIDKKWYDPFLGYALWFYGPVEFPVIQCLWPDKENRYPWDEGFANSDYEIQPLLYETDATKARLVSILKTMDINS
jgi:Domain of unknown function (DUF4262)